MAKSNENEHISQANENLFAPLAFFSNNDLLLDCGHVLQNTNVAYTITGNLNSDKSNAIMVCHPLTGDQYVTGQHPVTKKPGWWNNVVGADLPIDTNRFCVICTNVLGGCMGTTGPCSLKPNSSQQWGFDFPLITIPDMVKLQILLLDHLRIDRLLCVIGGSMGGMQALEWATRYTDRVYAAIAIATSYRQSPQNIALNHVGRQAVISDPSWHNGRYLDHGDFPSRGLAIARMLGHISYISEDVMEKKFNRRPQLSNDINLGFSETFTVEHYLKHQGESFTKRFDANSYLYVTRATDYFDLAYDYGGFLPNAFAKTSTIFDIISFSSDWLYPPSESEYLTKAIKESNANATHWPLESPHGHDSFLLEEPEFHSILKNIINNRASECDI